MVGTCEGFEAESSSWAGVRAFMVSWLWGSVALGGTDCLCGEHGIGKGATLCMEWFLHFSACRSGPCHKSGPWHIGLEPQNPCYDHSVRALSIHFPSILLFHQLAITRHRKCTQKGLVLVTMWLGGRELWLVADSLGWLGMGDGNGGWSPSSVPRVPPH